MVLFQIFQRLENYGREVYSSLKNIPPRSIKFVFVMNDLKCNIKTEIAIFCFIS